MDPLHPKAQSMPEGIKLVVYSENGPSAFDAHIRTTAPLTVELSPESRQHFSPNARAIAIYNGDDTSMKSECTILTARDCPECLTVELLDRPWEDLNRRVFPRALVRVPVDIQMLQGSSFQAFSGLSLDLSMGGVSVQSDICPRPGSLLKLSANLGSQGELQAIGMIVHVQTSASYFGIQFLDFYGDGKQRLGNFLSYA